MKTTSARFSRQDLVLEAKPDFIIIGAMKSATSTLHDQLSRQPGFWMSEPKEPNFFSDEDVWSQGLDWYSSLFAGAAPDDLRGESSTHYTKLPDYPECLVRMRAHVPDARLIYVMRHPVDRLISHYMHGWLEASITELINDAVDRHPQLVDYGLYSMQLRPYLETYGPECILPVFFERLTRHPQQELERVCSFLGYSGQPNWDETASARNVSRDRLRKSHMRDAILEFAPLQLIRRGLVPRSVRSRVKRIWQINQKPILSPETLQRVSAKFDEDLGLLGNWLGTDLECDNFTQVVQSAAPEWSDRTPSPLV
ncbi:MAG: sulfotransferase [Pseudomonadota bacterium]